MSTNLVIWAFPLAFVVHGLEEILTMERFVHEYRERFPKPLRGFAAITTLQFTIGVTILFALILLASFLATRPQGDMTLFMICLAIFLLHVITHVALSFFFRSYTPGLVTAVLVVLPYSLYAFHRLFTDGLLSTDDVTTSLLVGAVLAVPIIVGVCQLGKRLARS